MTKLLFFLRRRNKPALFFAKILPKIHHRKRRTRSRGTVGTPETRETVGTPGTLETPVMRIATTDPLRGS